MAEAVVTMALETLKDLLLEEGRFLVGVGSEVKKLQTQLKHIKCFLEDADADIIIQREGKMTSNWITEIRDLVYRAEDIILSYAVQTSDGRGIKFKQLLRRLPFVLSCGSLHQIGSEISNINSDLARISEEMEKSGIKKSIINNIGRGSSSAANNNQNWAKMSFPNWEIGDCFVGMKKDLEQIVSLVVDDKQHRVISIWGMGGKGKTSIAKKVYNQMIESKSFDSFAWVCITQQCNTRLVLEDVLKQLLDTQNEEDVSSLSTTQLIGRLCQVQTSKRCFIVMDDIWQTSHWDGLKHAFNVQSLGSKILVTTRNLKVAEIGFSLPLRSLNLEDAWELLKNKAFSHNHIPDSLPQLREVGKELIRKCGYLPLAICLVGGVLSKKNPNTEEWELVNRNMNTFIRRGEGVDEKENQISGVLNLSYRDLPYYLKPCFLYLGIFMEDEIVHASDLYRRWIAQGIVSDENIIRGKEESLRNIAELYLSELASRCMVQVEVVGVEPSRRYGTCKLHDVLREVCLSKGKNEGFGVEVLEYRNGKFGASLMPEASSSLNKTRHLGIHFEGKVRLECGSDHTISTSKHLRSLQIRNTSFVIQLLPQGMICFDKFKMLRELSINRFTFEGRKLPRGITKLVHLRYLRLETCELDELPLSMSNLTYLDTLFLLNSKNLRVPNIFKKMFRLKHLVLPKYTRETIGDYQLILDGEVDELQSLQCFDSRVHKLKSSTTMNDLQRFVGQIYDNESLLAIVNNIATNWNKLQHCSVSIKKGCELTTGTQGLMKSLKQLLMRPMDFLELMIYVRVGKLLEECNNDIQCSRLVSLSLSYCEIEEDQQMGILGKFPCLTQLELFSRSFVGEVLTCPASSFPRLKRLLLQGLPNMREWRVKQGAMPLLSKLLIYRCPGLNKVPDELSNISADDKLHIIQKNLQTTQLFRLRITHS